MVDIDSLPLSTEVMNFIHYTQNGYRSSVNLSPFTQLKSFQCGNLCFTNIDLFVINGLNHLESMTIGSNCFTKSKNSYDEREERKFHLTNCTNLQSLQIGQYSFSDYYVMELKNLPSLKSIIIGTTGTSYNFYYTRNVEFLGNY